MKTENMGININDKCQAFTDQILAGQKTIETRQTNSLKPYIGKRMGIVRTGIGKAALVGFVTIDAVKEYKTETEFMNDQERHLVCPGSRFHKLTGFGYTLSDPVKCEPVQINSRGIVARKLI